MASPRPDAAVPDPKPEEVPNGHAPPKEPAMTEPPVGASAGESRPEPASTKDASTTQQRAGSPKTGAESCALNGSGTADGPTKSDTDAVETDEVAPRTEAESTAAQPKPSDGPEPAAKATAAASTEEKVVEPKKDGPSAGPARGEDEPARAAKRSTPARSPSRTEDVEMREATPRTDSPPSGEAKTAKATTGPSEATAAAADGKTQDEDMTDAPAESSAGATETARVGDAAPPSQDAAALPTSEVDLGSASMSQLAIEGTGKASPAEASPEAPMADAPGAKVAREREDDTAEEPASKRARTEPKDDEASAVAAAGEPTASSSTPAGSTGVASDAPGLDMTVLTSLTRWSDSETNAKELSPFQRREIRKVIGRVKKTKAGAHFRDSVQKLWPFLWDSYIARIEKPMDLSELDRNVRDPNSSIVTLGQFRKDLALMFENALTFNGPAHDITAAAAQAVTTIWQDVLPIPVEEPARPKAVPKAKPAREPRAVVTESAARRQSTAPAPSPLTETAAPVTATPPEPYDDRRASTATDGDRPKRTVRAPKPKDIDYTTKPSRKKLKPELQFCDEVLTEIMHPKHHEINQWFLEPVDAEGLGIPTYHNVIKKPMDLGKVHHNLATGDISSLKDFDKNVRLVFDNCYKFNGPPDQGNPVSVLAKQLDDLYGAQMKNKDSWLARHAAKASAPAASTSNASDDDEEEDDDGEEATETMPNKAEIEALQAKLEEETTKLNKMLLSANEAMILVQRGIVDMVQNALIKAVKDAQTQPKSEKPAKKAGKGGRAKAAGGVGGRKSISGPGHAKKSGGGSKKAKKNLTAAEKDAIANAINDLDASHLDRAIDIIKTDTGQNENTEGELELDIDQLSTEALSKLWELCKKALPGFGKDLAGGPKSSPEVGRSTAKQGAKSASKPKKNKPMSAKEQEAKIAQLTALQNMYNSGQEPGEGEGTIQAPTPMADSSDDSDSEEE
ncbi:hypothetical protein RJ55_02396 [Drechmeria coniospora]|nr:hypothetical protein RJ55_02396 [Drechmeria coniospora]